VSRWYEISNADGIPSPALLFYPERIVENIRRMIRVAGGTERLRPHMKTHKSAEVVQLHIAQGITKFKCATIAEAEMVASCGAAEVLLAYQPVGPNTRRLCELIRNFPTTRFATTADDGTALRALSEAARKENVIVEVLLDLDCGQHRTGIEPGERAFELYKLGCSLPGLQPGGLHAYDGHIHDRDVKARVAACESAFAPVAALRERIAKAGLPCPRVVAGGTPTFPFHAKRADVECSPGTCVLWDWGYSTNLPDLDFLHSAALLTRVVSKPTANRLCLDLGHKAVASEMPHPRVHFPDLADAEPVAHNEEHLVVETPRASEFSVGAILYGIPWHVCPTVALHAEAVVVKDARTDGSWSIAARARRLSI
jgi:D-serine deaminase-like pyridoxal phosphate-dependent protein